LKTNRTLSTFVGKSVGGKFTTMAGAIAVATTMATTPSKAALTGFGPDNLLRTGSQQGPLGNGTQVGSEWTITATKCCSGNSVQIDAGTSTLTLGGGGGYNAGSAFANTVQSVSGFSSSFTFNQAASNGNNTQFAFVLQNDPRTTTAVDILRNGYAGDGAPIASALEVVFRSDGSVGFLNNTAASPQSATNAVTIATGLTFTAAPVTANLSYSGTTLTLGLTQGANSYNTTHIVNIPTLIGASTGYVGFDANRMDQGVTITNFSYSPVPEPSTFAGIMAGGVALLGLSRFRKNAAV